jgi:hypothetical protein
MNSKPDRPELINSMRFFPDWNINSGLAVCGLIEMMYDINELRDGKLLECVEVGSHKGESALLISSFPFIKYMHCIEKMPYTEIHDRLKHKVEQDQLKIVIDDSNNYAKQIPDKSIDMVYIDAFHNFKSVTNDLDVWSKKVKPEGFICGHDYNIKRWEGVVKAVDNFVGKNNMLLKKYRDNSYMIHWK